MIGSFTTAQSGLKSSQIALENSMNNIANENSVGYKKKVSYQAEVNYGNSYGNGVEITNIERQTNQYLFYKIIDETSTQSYYSEASSIYASAELIFNETDEAGLSKDLNNYFQSLENLRSNPSNLIYQSDFEMTSTTLVSNMQDTYKEIDEQQESLKNQTYNEVQSVNNILNEITQINQQMLENGEDPTLLDKRDNLEKELSTYVDIEVSDDDFYELEIAGERAVFNNTQAHEISVIEEYTPQIDIYDDVSLNDSNLTDGDTISVKLNNGEEISIVVDTTGASDFDVKQQIADAINANASMKDSVSASLDSKGNLLVESNEVGEDAIFDLEINLDSSNTNVSKNENLSKIGTDEVHLELLGQELELSSGSLKATTDNLTTTSPNNVLYSYKQDLNDLANSLIDMTSAYVKEGDDYIYGDNTSSTYTGSESVNQLNLFSGGSLMTMSFNSSSMENLSQEDLDYLSTLQWKDDINIDSSNPNSTSSFSDSLQALKVNVSSNKENMDFKLETKNAVVISLENSHDQLTKVDNDEEMINLMQFQAAYEANAKVITALDEMLQTVLNM